MEALNDHRMRQQMRIEDTQKAHEKHSKYLNATMDKYVFIDKMTFKRGAYFTIF